MSVIYKAFVLDHDKFGRELPGAMLALKGKHAMTNHRCVYRAVS